MSYALKKVNSQGHQRKSSMKKTSNGKRLRSMKRAGFWEQRSLGLWVGKEEAQGKRGWEGKLGPDYVCVI